jgi:hypothetical protein
MGWAVGFDPKWQRDIGYGVPGICDRPTCGEAIDRGLAYVCGGRPFGGERGCGLFFCATDLLMDEGGIQLCRRCIDGAEPFEATPDAPEWTDHKMTDPSWAHWRAENGVPELTRKPGQ